MASTSIKSYHRESLFDLAGHTALVTGAGSGIGLIIAQTLAANGAKVYIAGRDGSKLQRVVDAWGGQGSGELIPVTGNVTDKASIGKVAEFIASRERCLSILVNNAGISSAKLDLDATQADELKGVLFDSESSSFDDWTGPYTTNVAGMFFTTAAFLPLLQKSTEVHKGWSGTVVNITSMSGMIKMSQSHFSYNASKAAAIHLTRMMSSEIAMRGLKIRCNSLAPGLFPSEMTTDGSDERQKSSLPKEAKDDIPAQRPGTDQDMASAVLFFVCNQYLNGQSVAIDGGYSLDTGL